ncbi:MAG: glycosyltransferase family 2 protein [Acidobacteria bacterium]|nr:glycosyltransferase family 2 protein [Acidobacteriota bacterium]
MNFQPELNYGLISMFIFFASVVAIIYVYIGYPLLAYVISKLIPWPIRQAKITPSVSVIIAAHNEEKDIAAKIENTLALDYPGERLEIIVASDCSSDRTDEIVRRYSRKRVILFRQNERFGKTMAQHKAVLVSSGDILVFSDATTMYQPNVIKKIVRNFADPTVGCVTGQLVYSDQVSSAVGQGCRSYWNYEKFIKQCENGLGSLIGVSGCLYSVRRTAQAKLAKDMIDDFVIATEIHLQGLRSVYEPEAISIEDTNNRSRDEFRMRVRIIEQTISALHRYQAILNPFKHGMFAFQMISHKVLRYTIPLWLILAIVSSAQLALSYSLFRFVLAAELAFILLALAGYLFERMNIKSGPLSLPFYFALVNVASVAAFLKFIKGHNHVVWEPIRESNLPSRSNNIVSHAQSTARS